MPLFQRINYWTSKTILIKLAVALLVFQNEKILTCKLYAKSIFAQLRECSTFKVILAKTKPNETLKLVTRFAYVVQSET